MRKFLIFITLLLLTGCGNPKYTQISYSQLNDKLNNKDSFILLIGSETCSACAEYEKTMTKVMKDTKVEIFYINLHSLTDEENTKIYSKFVFQYTPTTIFIKDGEETTTYDRIVGAADYKEVIDNLKKQGYVEE